LFIGRLPIAVSEEIESASLQLKLVGDEKNLLQLEVESKAKLLSEINEEVCGSRIHLSLLKQQKEKLLSEREDAQQQLQQIVKDMDTKRCNFLESISDFAGRYGTMTKVACRDERDREMYLLNDRILLLKSELESVKRNKGELALVTRKVSEMKEAVETEGVFLCDAIARCQKLESELHQMKQDHNLVTADPNIVQFQNELEQYRRQTPEDSCKTLKKELETVQREYYNHRWKKQAPSGSQPDYNYFPSVKDCSRQQDLTADVHTDLQWDIFEDDDIFNFPLETESRAPITHLKLN
jgi:chromosome segregation ATPase